MEDNIIIKQYIEDNTWTLGKDNKIHIKKPKVREAVEKGITLRGGIVQEWLKAEWLLLYARK